MSDKEIIDWSRKEYGLHKNVKIKINKDTYTITIRMGETAIDLPYPKSLMRHIKIELILWQKE